MAGGPRRSEGAHRRRNGRQIERLINDAVGANHVNFVCLWIDSPGGQPDECLGLAEFLAGLDPAAVRTVAYIPSEARRRPPWWPWPATRSSWRREAVLGGPGSPQMSRNEIDLAVQRVRDGSPRGNCAPGRFGRR